MSNWISINSSWVGTILFVKYILWYASCRDLAKRIIGLRDIWNDDDDDDDDDDGDSNEIQLKNNVASVELKNKKYRIGDSFLSIKDDDAINNRNEKKSLAKRNLLIYFLF